MYSPEIIVNRIEQIIKEFDLPRERTKRNNFDDEEKIDRYKTAYNSLRATYNYKRNIFDFYTLTFFSFSQQFRFNSKGEFNMPYGNDCFCEKYVDYINNGCEFFGKLNVFIESVDFKTILLSDDFGENTFFYCDPPYYNTTATYNENNGWTKK